MKSEKSGGLMKTALVIAGAAVFAAGVYMAWTSTGRDRGPRIVVVGMDGLTWDIMNPMLDQNKLPNFQALIRRGVHGKLKTLRSTYISASIWTTILTGKQPKKHGIKGFFSTRGFPVNSSHRKTRFLPQILGDQGVKTAVVGFMATWPAEKINGYIVSDLASYGRFKDASPKANQSVQDYSYLENIKSVTWPEELKKEIIPVMMSPDQVPGEIYKSVLPMTDPEWEKFQKIDRISRENELSLLKFSVVTDLNFHRSGLFILNKYRPQAYLVYFQGPDIMEHFFWKYMEPEYFAEVTLEDSVRYQEVIWSYYSFMDRLLGEIVDEVGPDTLVIVCSDHGQKRVRYWGQDGLHSGEHRLSKPPGILVMAGAGVNTEPERELEEASVLDIVPTILYLSGLPVGKDMDGKILLQAVTDEYQLTYPLVFISTYDSDLQEKEEVYSPIDDKIRERLRAIGYID